MDCVHCLNFVSKIDGDKSLTRAFSDVFETPCANSVNLGDYCCYCSANFCLACVCGMYAECSVNPSKCANYVNKYTKRPLI